MFNKRNRLPKWMACTDLARAMSGTVLETSLTTARRYPGQTDTGNGTRAAQTTDWLGWRLASQGDAIAESALELMHPDDAREVRAAREVWQAQGVGPSRRGFNFRHDDNGPDFPTAA